jgi:hypothetical protein
MEYIRVRLMPVILATQETEIWTIEGRGQPKQTVSETISQPIKKLGMGAHVCHPSHMGSINRRIVVQACPGINTRCYLKNSKNKEVWWSISTGRVPA